MRVAQIAAGTAIALALTIAPLHAAPKGSNGPSAKASSTKAPKLTKTTTAPKAPKVKNAKVTTAKVTTTRVTTAKSAKAPKVAKTSTTPSTGTSGTTTAVSTTTTPTTIDFTKGAVAERLAKNANLRTKLASRLLATGYEGTVYQAAYGFKNQGQFIAATNVSQNTGVSFEQLKVQMTGLSIDADGMVLKANLGPDGKITMVDPADVTTPAPTRSLGQAIKAVSSTVDATAAAQTATSQADAEIAAATVTN